MGRADTIRRLAALAAPALPDPGKPARDSKQPLILRSDRAQTRVRLEGRRGTARAAGVGGGGCFVGGGERGG